MPAIPAEALQNRQQPNIQDPLNPVSSHQESFTSTTTDGNKPTNEFTEKTINVTAKLTDENAKDKMENVKNREYGCKLRNNSSCNASCFTLPWGQCWRAGVWTDGGCSLKSVTQEHLEEKLGHCEN